MLKYCGSWALKTNSRAKPVMRVIDANGGNLPCAPKYSIVTSQYALTGESPPRCLAVYLYSPN